MKIVLLWCCLVAAFGGAAGFILPPCITRFRVAPAACALRSPPMSSVCRGALATSRGCSSGRSLRMGADVEADGGSSDGAALAEARIVVHGQATGGYFRAHARNEAHFNRKLCGALKELGKGQTEIIVEGKTSAIRSFLRWCKKGPGLTQLIEDVTVDWTEYTGIFDGFEVFPEADGKNNQAGVP